MSEARRPSAQKDEKVFRYLSEHHVLTIASSNGDDLWCASCFYVFAREQRSFFIMTESTTRHGQLMTACGRIAGTVADQTANVARIRGFQFSGTARVLEGEERNQARSLYCRRFPVALASRAPIWQLSIKYGKFTDNTLGFGTKIIFGEHHSDPD